MKGMSDIPNQYLYTSCIQQKAYKSWHKYHEKLKQLVPFHGSVLTGRIPKLI